MTDTDPFDFLSYDLLPHLCYQAIACISELAALIRVCFY